MDVLKYLDSDMSIQRIADNHDITPTMIRHWRKRKDELTAICIDNAKSIVTTRRLPGASRKPNAELDIKLMEWFNERVSKNLRIKDKFLKKKAVMISRELDIDGVQGSNEFILNFKVRQNITSRAVTGARKLPDDAMQVATKILLEVS